MILPSVPTRPICASAAAVALVAGVLTAPTADAVSLFMQDGQCVGGLAPAELEYRAAEDTKVGITDYPIPDIEDIQWAKQLLVGQLTAIFPLLSTLSDGSITETSTTVSPTLIPTPTQRVVKTEIPVSTTNTVVSTRPVETTRSVATSRPVVSTRMSTSWTTTSTYGRHWESNANGSSSRRWVNGWQTFSSSSVFPVTETTQISTSVPVTTTVSLPVAKYLEREGAGREVAEEVGAWLSSSDPKAVPEWSYVSDSDNLNLMASGSQSGGDGDTVYLVDGVLTTELPPYEPEEDPNPLPPELIDFPGDFWADRVTDVLDASAGAQSFIITVENYGKNDFVFDISVILGRGKPGERTVKLSVPTGPRETVEVAVPILPEDMVREKLIDGQRLPYRITDGHHKFDSSIRVSNLPLPTVTATATATTTSVATETTTVEPSPVSETVTLIATTTTSPEPTEPFESTKDPTQIAGGSTTGELTDTTAGDITGIVVGVVGLMAALAVAVGSLLDNLGIVVPKITDFL